MSYKQMKVLVTGGAGFIGSSLVAQLSEQGAKVVVVDNLVNGKESNLVGTSQGSVRLERVDIRDRDRMSLLMKDVGIVFHLAALGVRQSIHSPRENHEVNATGTLDLLTEARRAGVSRFVHVSTSEIYGTGYKVPMDENHPAFPMTIYGAAKLAGESYARAFYRTYGYPTVIIRPFNTFGPRCHHEGDSGEVIPKWMLRILADEPIVVFGDGEQTRDFTFVSDTARGILLAGLADNVLGETINIGSGKEITINSLAAKMATVLGKPGARVIHDSPRPGDTLRLYADINKARALLGFEPQIRLDDGLQKLRDWYLSQNKTPQELLKDDVVHNWEVVKE